MADRAEDIDSGLAVLRIMREAKTSRYLKRLCRVRAGTLQGRSLEGQKNRKSGYRTGSREDGRPRTAACRVPGDGTTRLRRAAWRKKLSWTLSFEGSKTCGPDRTWMGPLPFSWLFATIVSARNNASYVSNQEPGQDDLRGCQGGIIRSTWTGLEAQGERAVPRDAGLDDGGGHFSAPVILAADGDGMCGCQMGPEVMITFVWHVTIRPSHAPLVIGT